MKNKKNQESQSPEKECVFCKIIKGELPCKKIYEDKEFLAFLDIMPISPGHTLIIPKKHYKNLLSFPKQEDTALLELIKKISLAITKAVSADGFNLGMNNGEAAGQSVMHAHMHIIPRFKNDGLKSWPHQNIPEQEMSRIKDKIVRFL